MKADADSAHVGGGVEGASEWRAWPMLVAAMVCYCCSTMPLTALGALVKPLSAEFGWSRASITSVFLITAAGTMLLAPIVGHVVDRTGPRRVALIGLPLLTGGIALIGTAGPSIWSWYACWAVYAVCQACAGNVIWANAVVGHFDRHRGMALAILLSAHALTYGVLPSFAVFTVSALSWRWVFFFLAGFVILIAWPLAWRFIYGVNDSARGQAVAAVAVAAPVAPAAKGALLAIVCRLQFWQIALAFFMAATVVSGLFVHLQPILTDRGMTPAQAAGVAVILGPASLIGRFCTGFVLDRFPANRVAAIALILPGFSYVILMLAGHSTAGAFACALFLGVAGGAESDLMAYLVSRYFGKQSFGACYGILLGLYALGYGVGPIVAGRVFDVLGTYEPIFIVAAGGALAGSAMILALGPPRASGLPHMN